jgi:hypothetical protein
MKIKIKNRESALEDQLKQQGFEGPSKIPRYDLTKKFNDYISELQQAVNDALNGDEEAFRKVEEAFGFTPSHKT